MGYGGPLQPSWRPSLESQDVYTCRPRPKAISASRRPSDPNRGRSACAVRPRQESVCIRRAKLSLSSSWPSPPGVGKRERSPSRLRTPPGLTCRRSAQHVSGSSRLGDPPERSLTECSGPSVIPMPPSTPKIATSGEGRQSVGVAMLAWFWRYSLPSTQRHSPLSPGFPTFRDTTPTRFFARSSVLGAMPACLASASPSLAVTGPSASKSSRKASASCRAPATPSSSSPAPRAGLGRLLANHRTAARRLLRGDRHDTHLRGGPHGRARHLCRLQPGVRSPAATGGWEALLLQGLRGKGRTEGRRPGLQEAQAPGIERGAEAPTAATSSPWHTRGTSAAHRHRPSPSGVEPLASGFHPPPSARVRRPPAGGALVMRRSGVRFPSRAHVNT